MAKYQQLFSEAERQQALADQLTQRAMQPRGPQQHGRIVAATHIGEGLGQLGEALIARRAGKKATSMTAAAEEAKRQEQAAALAGMSGQPAGTPAPANRYAQSQGALDAGIDPSVVGAYLKDQQPDAGADSSSLAGYRQAKSEGYAGSYTDYKTEFEGREASVPSSVKEWRVYNAMTPEQKASYLEMKRTGQITDIAGVPNVVPPGTGTGVAQPAPLSTIEDEEGAKRRLAAAQAEGAAAGGAQGGAQATLPQAEATATTALETIAQLRDHPGRLQATGASRIAQAQQVPGTPAYDFEVLRKQAAGQVFLNAYQQLKGGGVITEIEGLKAEQALARMDAAQSEQAYLDALTDYEQIINRGLEVARQRAGATSPGAPRAGEVQDGYRFKGGDPSQQSSWERVQ